MIKYLTKKLEVSHSNHKTMLPMEGLRGLAVFMVFLVHYSSLITPWISTSSTNVATFIHSFGNLGVDLFFVLSGYLIYGSIITRDFSPKPYTERRIRRIYPTFLAVLCLYVTLSVLLPSHSKFPDGFQEITIYLLQNVLLLPGIFDIEPIITVAWSLSYEVFYYIIIPILVLLMSMKSWTTNARILFWSATTALGFYICYLYGGHVRLLMFVCGIVLFELKNIKGLQFKHGGTLCLITALILYGLIPFSSFNHIIALFLVYILFFVLCWTAFSEGSLTAKWLVFTPLRWLGNMSYSYYLIHGLTLQFAFLVLGYLTPATYTSGTLYYWLWIPLFMATLGVSFVLFVVIERPFSLDKR